MDTDELTQTELDDQRGDLLPEREAMSLVTPDPATAYPMPDGDLPPIVDDTAADGSASEQESVTDADRSEHFTSSESASAGGNDPQPVPSPPHTGT